MDIHISDVVESLNGRDKGKLFFVLGIEEGYAVIADGKGRRIEKPKRKKLKHLRLAVHNDGRTAAKIRGGEKLTNNELRRSLAQIESGEHKA